MIPSHQPLHSFSVDGLFAQAEQTRLFNSIWKEVWHSDGIVTMILLEAVLSRSSSRTALPVGLEATLSKIARSKHVLGDTISNFSIGSGSRNALLDDLSCFICQFQKAATDFWLFSFLTLEDLERQTRGCSLTIQAGIQLQQDPILYRSSSFVGLDKRTDFIVSVFYAAAALSSLSLFD